MADNSTKKKAIPPYLPFKTFSNFLDTLKPTMPQRIDRSLMGSMAGGTQSQLMAALEYLHLIHPETGIPTENLNKLVHAKGDERRSLLAEILTSSYGFLFDDGLDLERATMDLLQERFRQAGVSGDTLRKAVAFWLKTAREAGMKLSPHLKRTYTRRATGPRAKRKTDQPEELQKKVPPGSVKSESIHSDHPSLAEIVSEKFPAFNPEWTPEVQEKWFASFDRLIERLEKKKIPE